MPTLIQRKLVDKKYDGDLPSLLRQAETGDQILLCRGYGSYWQSHPLGVVIRKENKLLLNNRTLLFEGGRFRGWCLDPQDTNKVIVLKVKEEGNTSYEMAEFYFKDELLCRLRKWWLRGWRFHPQGVVILREHQHGGGSTFELNGKEVLYETDNQYLRGWDVIPGTNSIISQEEHGEFYCDGKKLNYDFGHREVTKWQICRAGLVFSTEESMKEGRLLFIKSKGRKVVDYYKPPRRLKNFLPKIFDDWQPHPHGIVFKEGHGRMEKLILVVKK